MSPQPRRGLLPGLLVLLVLLPPLAAGTHDPLDPLHAPTELPDLYPSTDDVGPVDETASPRICANVQNVAMDSVVATPFTVELRVDDVAVNASFVNERLHTGQGVRLCWILGSPLPRGYHVFTVVADSEEDVPEANETNNLARDRWFYVGSAPMPDLRVKTFYVYPRVAVPNQYQSFVIEVHNAGRADSQPVRVELRDDTGVLGEGAIPGIPKQTSQRFSLLTNPDVRPVGNFTAYVLVDPFDQLAELNEMNNDASYAYEIPMRPMPDLVLRSANLTGEPLERRGLRLDVEFANAGAQNAYRPILRLMAGNATLANATRSTLTPGANGSVSFHFVLPAGTHELRVLADPDGVIHESNETNNVLALDVTIRPAPLNVTFPNLVVRSLDAMPTDPGPDEPVLLTALVHNAGGNATNASHVAFYVDGKLVGRKPLPALRPDSYYNVAFPWAGGKEGDHDLRVVVDPDDGIREADEKDNLLTSYVALLPPRPKTPPPTNGSGPDVIRPDNGTTPGEGDGGPPTPPGDDGAPPTPEPPAPETPTPKVNVGELTIATTPVEGGVKGLLVLSLRNPTLDQVPRMSIAFTVDGQPIKEVLLAGLAPAGSASVSSGDVELPPGKHVVKAEVRVLGTDVRASAENTYDAQPGERGIPAPGLLAAVAVLALLAACRRRREKL